MYQLAKELGIDSQTLLTQLKEQGEFVRSASSTISPPVVRLYRRQHRQAPVAAETTPGPLSAPTWVVTTPCGGTDLPAHPLPPGDRVDVQGCPCGSRVHRVSYLHSRHVEPPPPAPTPPKPAPKPVEPPSPDREQAPSRSRREPAAPATPARPSKPADTSPQLRTWLYRGWEWVTLADLAALLNERPVDIEFDLRAAGATLRTRRRRKSVGGLNRVIRETMVDLQSARSTIDSHRRRREARAATPHHPEPRTHPSSAPRPPSDAASTDPSAPRGTTPGDGLPATPRALADELGVPVGEVLRRLHAAGIPARTPDEVLPAALRRLARTLATAPPAQPAASPEHQATPGSPAIAADTTPDPSDTGRGLTVTAGQRLDRDQVKDLRADLHRRPPPNLGAAVRSTRATVTFWAHEDALDALATVETPTGGPLDLGFTPPAGWLLFSQCTDQAGRPGAGNVRGLSWQWVTGGSDVEAFLWRSPDPAGANPEPARAFTFRLDEPWPAGPDHALLARWWKLLSTGWIDPEPQPVDPPPDRPDPKAVPAPGTTGRDRPEPREVTILRWRTPRLPTPNTAVRPHPRPAGTRQPPSRHEVRPFTRMAWVGPGRQQLVRQFVASHPRGGNPHADSRGRYSEPVRTLIVYELRAPRTPHLS